MKKIIFSIVLIICGVIVFLYIGKDTVSLTNEDKKQETQQPMKVSIVKSKLNSRGGALEALNRKLDIDNVKPRVRVVEEDVINSYPIEEADIHFVPPEQRYPGNLGGPPPLDFPEPG